MASQRAQSVCVVLHLDDSAWPDRVAIVTGGSRGIGREVARTLAGRGYAVVVNYAGNQARADAVVEELLAANGTALAVRGDVADELDVERLFTETTEAFGGVDVVVHAAGQMILGGVADYDLDTFDALQRTNVRGTFVVHQQAKRRPSRTTGGTGTPRTSTHASREARGRGQPTPPIATWRKCDTFPVTS
jgi:NAD(P)-dependent dehydrogenase (short-subunit alcohol dehydrogenase family)